MNTGDKMNDNIQVKGVVYDISDYTLMEGVSVSASFVSYVRYISP